MEHALNLKCFIEAVDTINKILNLEKCKLRQQNKGKIIKNGADDMESPSQRDFTYLLMYVCMYV